MVLNKSIVKSQLNPKIDGLIKCYGRLNNADLPGKQSTQFYYQQGEKISNY